MLLGASPPQCAFPPILSFLWGAYLQLLFVCLFSYGNHFCPILGVPMAFCAKKQLCFLSVQAWLQYQTIKA